MSKFFDTTSERRQAPRTKLAEIAYIGMGPENGGLVLDVSDGGLSFQSVAPVQPAETINFLLSLRGHSRIEGAGEVVWTNEMKTVCGLKFTSLSSGAREHLNNWTTQSQLPAAARVQAIPLAPLQIFPVEEIADKELPPAEPAMASQDAVADPEPPVFAIHRVREAYLSQSAIASSRLSPFLARVLFACLGAALGVTAYIYGVHVGQSQINSKAAPSNLPATLGEVPAPGHAAESGSSIAPTASKAPEPSASISAPEAEVAGSIHSANTPNAATSIPNVAPSQPNGTFVNASKSQDEVLGAGGRTDTGERSVATPVKVKQSAEAGKAQLAAGLANLNGDNGKRDIAKAVQELWKAVSNGNAEAEVILADLYATGDGVAQNCEQAQVLLRTATKSGNAQAKVKLDELNSNGCQ
jgi:hypothetical protein